MKINRLLNLVIATLLLAATATAQDVNKLYLSEMTGMKNRSLDMPVYLENTSSGIVAFQFDVKTPDGVTLSTSGNKADDTRATDHKVNVRKLSDSTYRVMMLSPTNRPIRANRGSVASIVASIGNNAPLEENGVYPIILSNVVVSDSLGNNIATSFENGALRIGANPDFIVKDVALVAAARPSTPRIQSPSHGQCRTRVRPMRSVVSANIYPLFQAIRVKMSALEQYITTTSS